MSTSPDEQHHLTAKQERRWFGTTTLLLIGFFVLIGGMLSWMQWCAKVQDRANEHALMDTAALDPGVTAAEPTDTSKATEVAVGVYLERIPELSIKEAKWSASFDLWFRWRGDLPNPGESFVLLDATIDNKELLAETNDNGLHYVRYRVEATITKSFCITRFPVDEHLLTIALESGDQSRQRLLFVPDTESTSVSSRVTLPGYAMIRFHGIEKAHSYKTTRGDPALPPGTKSTFSQYRFGMFLQRKGWGLYSKMFQALFVAVAVAMLACFIKPTDVDPRFGLGVGGLFAAVANAYLVGSFVPDTGELALADVINAIGIITILITLVVSTVSLYLYDRCGEEELSRRLDKVAFQIMLSCFLGINALLVIAAAA